MGACFGKTNESNQKLEIIDPQNIEDHKLIMTSLGAIEENFKAIAQNNNGYLSKIESQFEEVCRKNEESTLANREQIDYLIRNCVAFGERIKNLEIHVKDDNIHITGISKSQAIQAIQAITEIREIGENPEIRETQETLEI
jgi:hypothetical protein